MNYYNTTSLAGPALKQALGQCVKQTDQILVLFLYMEGAELSPFEVQQLAGMTDAPITSIRRALTDLTNAGKLIKTRNMKQGPYGKQSHTWRLA